MERQPTQAEWHDHWQVLFILWSTGLLMALSLSWYTLIFPDDGPFRPNLLLQFAALAFLFVSLRRDTSRYEDFITDDERETMWRNAKARPEGVAASGLSLAKFVNREMRELGEKRFREFHAWKRPYLKQLMLWLAPGIAASAVLYFTRLGISEHNWLAATMSLCLGVTIGGWAMSSYYLVFVPPGSRHIRNLLVDTSTQDFRSDN